MPLNRNFKFNERRWMKRAIDVTDLFYIYIAVTITGSLEKIPNECKL